MTVLEQLDAKTKSNLLTPSDVLAISSFMRKLVFRLMGQFQNLIFLDFLVDRVDRILSESRLWKSDHPTMAVAIRTEVKMMRAATKFAQPVEIPSISSPSLQDQLKLIDCPPSSMCFIAFAYRSCAD